MRPRVALLSLLLISVGLGVPAVTQPPAPKAAGFAIVAPRAFQAALAGYVAHKAKQLPVEVVVLEDVCKEQSGDDDAEKLKRFLYNRWKEKRLAYALLVGDIDVMPVRYRTITVGDGKKPPTFVFNLTDHYYADVADAAGNFEDWNKLRSGPHRWLYAESRLLAPHQDVNADGMHFIPELAVGRWPVSTPQGAKLLAEKTIRYETALQAGTKPGMHRAAVLAWDDLGPRGSIPHWVAALKGWQTTTYDALAGEPKPSAGRVTEQLNQGLGLLLDIGHGECNGWPGFKRANLAGVKNSDRLPIVFSVGCDTTPLGPGALPTPGYRDREERVISAEEMAKANPPRPPGVYQPELRKQTAPSFGQQMLIGGPSGAVAYIGFTINSNHWHELMDGFVMAMGQKPAPRLGDAWAFALTYHHQARKAFVQKHKGDFDGLHSFDQGLRAILLGDPTLLLPQ